MVSRRRFMGVAAGLPLVGPLLLSGSTLLEGTPPVVGEQPVIYLPEKPAILTATRIERPLMDSAIMVTDWRINVESPRPMWTLGGEMIPLPPSQPEVEIRGLLTDMTWLRNDLGGRRLRMYLVAEDGG